jgi:hypothetical protein
MYMQITDSMAPRFRGPGPPPRGLLPVPPEIQEQIAKDQSANQPYYTDEYAKLIRDDWTLRYYYEGAPVLCRTTPAGIEVLAAGLEEIGQLMQNMSQEELLGVTFKQV